MPNYGPRVHRHLNIHKQTNFLHVISGQPPSRSILANASCPLTSWKPVRTRSPWRAARLLHTATSEAASRQPGVRWRISRGSGGGWGSPQSVVRRDPIPACLGALDERLACKSGRRDGSSGSEQVRWTPYCACRGFPELVRALAFGDSACGKLGRRRVPLWEELARFVSSSFAP